jgi:hypothetical protein
MAKTVENDQFDSLLQLRGSGRELWADEHADEYIARLRSDWGSSTRTEKDPA